MFVGLSGIDVIVESDIIIQKREVKLQECYKDRLLANLYSTVEFLKQELVEKNKIINSILSKNWIISDVYNKSHDSIKTNNTKSSSASEEIETSTRTSTSKMNYDDQLISTTVEKYNDSNTCENPNLSDFLIVSNAPEEVFNGNYTENINVITTIGDEIKEKLLNQLNELRKHKHSEYKNITI